MNFECLFDSVKQYQYEEIRIIGRDIKIQGKTVHIAAMIRRDDQLEICLLVQEEPRAKEMPALQQRHSQRELMKHFISCQNGASIQQMDIGGVVFHASGSSSGVLNTGDLGGLYLMEKLIDAGWKLCEDHVFFRQDWEDHPILLMQCRFFCPSFCLADLDLNQPNIRVTWASYPVWHLIEQPVLLEVGHAAEDARKELSFTLFGQDGTAQEGICYINRVILQDMWETEEQRFADPQYQEQMLAYMSQEEFAAMKQQSLEMLAQICPRGMCFPVVEYECTLQVGLDFYTQDYLNAPPACRSSSIMYLTRQKEELGEHGLQLRSCIMQSPVPPDTKKISAELFQAVQTVPERCEELELQPDRN